MEYFKFDLQLFANVDLTLEGVTIVDNKFTTAPTADGYIYSIINEGANISVRLANGEDILGTFSITDVINGIVSFTANEALGGVLESDDYTITIANGEGVSLHTVDFSSPTVGSITIGKGVAVTMADGNVITNVVIQSDDEYGIDEGTVTVTAAGNIVSYSTIAQIEIAKGGSVAFDSTVWTNEADGVTRIQLQDVATQEVQLISGAVSSVGQVQIFFLGSTIVHDGNEEQKLIVDSTLGVTKAEGGCHITSNGKNCPIIVNGVTYKNEARDPAGDESAQIELSSTLAATLIFGFVKFGGKDAAGKDASIMANNYTITTTTENEITVDQSGTVSNLTASAAFTVTGGTEDVTLRTYTYTISEVTDGKADIVVSGDYIGVYNDVVLADTAITLQNGADAVATISLQDDGITEMETPVIAAAVAFAYEAGKNFYALVNTNGVLSAVGAETAAEAVKTPSTIGYFEFSGVDGVETVTFRDKDGVARSLIGGVSVDAKELTTAGESNVTKIVVTGVTAEENDVALTNVAKTVTEVDGTLDWSEVPTTVTCDLSAIRDKLSGTKSYYLVNGEWTAEWPEDASKVTAVFDAKYRELSVKAKNTDIVSIVGVNASELMGTGNGSAGISFVEGFAIEDGQILGANIDENANVSVIFGDSSLSHLAFSNVIMKGDNISFDAGVLCKIRIPAGATLTAVSPTPEVGDTETLTVHEGRLSVTYEGRGHDFVVGDFSNCEDGTTKATISDNDGTTTFSVTIANGKLDGAVTGDDTGRFLNVDAATAQFTIPATGWRNLSDKNGVVECVDADLRSLNFATRKNAEVDSITDYFTVSWDEAKKGYVLSAASDAPPEDFDNLVGYFKLVVNDNGGQPTAELTFHNAAEKRGHAEWLGNVFIDVFGLHEITLKGGGTAKLAKLDVTDVASNEDTLFVYNFPATTEIEGLGRPEVQIKSRVTCQDFQWDGVGYFEGLALDPSKPNVYNFDWSSEGDPAEPPYPPFAHPIEAQNYPVWIGGDDAGKVYLEVQGMKDEHNIANIEKMRLVEMQEDGSFVEYTGVVGNVVIDANSLDGVSLPQHTGKIRIWEKDGAKAGGVFTGLNDSDVVWIEKPINGTITVNGKDFTAAGSPVTVTGAGTISDGTFTVKGSAFGSSVLEAEGNQEAAKEIICTGGNGVNVTFKDGEITSIKGLDSGETVTVNWYQYTAKGDKRYETWTIEKNGTTVKKIMTTSEGANIVMTKTVEAGDASNTDVFAEVGYKMTGATFDFGKTKDGSVAIFEVDDRHAVEIKAQTPVSPVIAEGKEYVKVGATKTTSGYIINSIETLICKDGALVPGRSDASYGYIATLVTAPTDGNLTFSGDFDNRQKLEYHAKDYKIGVKHAQSGRSYIGLTGEDIVYAEAEAGATFTIGTTAKTAKQFKTAAACDVGISGSGKVVEGTFYVGSGLEAPWAKITSSVKSNVAVTISYSRIVNINLGGLVAGETLTATETDYYGAVSTTIYKATKNTKTGKLQITRTVMYDGVIKTQLCVGKFGDTYRFETTSVSIDSTFDWITNRTGYFAVTTAEDGSIFAAVEETRTQATKEKNKGETYLKIEPSADSVDPDSWVLSLQKVAINEETGLMEMEDVAWAGTTGTLDITAPTASRLRFDRAKAIPAEEPSDTPVALPAGIHLTISGVAAGSEISNLQDGDVVATAKLAAGESITVNGEVYTAGDTGLLKLKYEKVGEPPAEQIVAKVSDGALLIAEDATVQTTTGQYVVNVNGERDDEVPGDTVVVKVVGGEVTAISGLTFEDVNGDGSLLAPLGEVTVTDKNGYTVIYNAAAANYGALTPDKDVKTAVLESGQRVSFNTTGKSYMVGATGALTFKVTAGGVPQLSDGVIALGLQGDETSIALSSGKTVHVTANPRNKRVFVTVKGGEIVSITGMTFDTEVVVGDADASKVGNTVYHANSNAVVRRWEIGQDPDNDAVRAYLPTANGDVYNAKYLVANPTVDISEAKNAYEGQFNWLGIDGRCLGYFEVKGNAVTIADQNKRSQVGAPKGGTEKNPTKSVWVAANSVQPEGSYLRVLSIGALMAKSNGSITFVSGTSTKKLLQDVTITVNAPAAQAIKFAKSNQNNTFHIILNKVAYGSRIVDLEAGDSFTTSSLDMYQRIFLADGGREEPNLINNTYVAGAKGTILTFQGEGKRSDGSNKTTLLNGTILLRATHDDKKYITPSTATLSGSKGDKLADNITVTAGGNVDDYITVVAKDGKVKSITGLRTKGARVVIDPTNGGKGKAVVYTVLDAAGTMIERQEYAIDGGVLGAADAETLRRKNITAGKEIYDATGTTYKEVVLTDISNLSFKKTAKTFAYIALGDETALGDAKKVASVDGGVASDIITNAGKTAFKANAGGYYLKISASTNVSTDGKTGVTQITAVDLLKADALGKLSAAKGVSYTGTLTLDGTMTSDPKTYGIFTTYTLPKTRTWALKASNVAAGSEFKGLDAAKDRVATADMTEPQTLKNGTFYFYNDNGTGTDVRTIVVSNSDGVSIRATKDDLSNKDPYKHIASLTGLDKKGETVTLTEQTKAGGKETIEYKVVGVDNTNDTVTVQRKATRADGITEIKKITVLKDADMQAEETLALFDIVTEKDTTYQIGGSVFDWTMANSTTTYAEAAATAVIKAGKIVVNNPRKPQIALTIDADGVVASVRQVMFGDGRMTKFSGTIKVTAPTTTALTFDRKATLDTTGENATISSGAHVAVTGAIAGSRITNLGYGDTAETARLTAGQSVTVDVENGTNVKFTAGAAGKLSFDVFSVAKQDKPEDPVEYEDLLAVTGGTFALEANDSCRQGGNYVYLYAKKSIIKNKDEIEFSPKRIMAMKGNITVTVSTTKKTSSNGDVVYATSYTVGDLKEGESFTVTDYKENKEEISAERIFKRTSAGLFCEVNGVTYIYNLGTKTKVDNSVLDLFVDPKDPTKLKKGWSVCGDGTIVFKDGVLVNAKASVTAALATLDKRLAADKATAGGAADTYAFVIDKYMANPKKFSGAASVITKSAYLDVQQLVGMITDNYVYTATSNIAQTIQATNGWTAKGSILADVLVGAAKGSDTLIGGLGDDTLTGGGANDLFVFGEAEGKDVVKNYVTGKDKIIVAKDINDWKVEEDEEDEQAVAEAKATKYTDLTLDKHFRLVATKSGRTTTADAMIYDGSENADNYVLLSGMGNGKAVTINDKTYFFGSELDKKGRTFSYVDGGYYVGKGGTTTANTLSVGTDKSKATKTALGDTRFVDLSDTTHYKNIGAVDASKSGNALILTAAGSGSTLKGGTYQSTLRGGVGADSLVGGSGADVFWFDAVEQDDVVSGYTSANDSVYLGDVNAADTENTNATKINGMTIEAVGNDVVITGADGKVTLQKAVSAKKAVVVRTDEDGTDALSYYVGSTKARAVNEFSAVIGTDTKTDNEEHTALKSYYIGSADVSATDKLIITTKKLAKGEEAQGLNATFSLQDGSHLSAVDLIDAHGIVVAKGSTVKYEGKNRGSFTLIGSASANVEETFSLAGLTATEGKKDEKAIITNFTIGDVIELGAGMTLTRTSGEKANDTIYNVKIGDADYGTLTITGVNQENLDYDSGSHKIRYVSNQDT